MNPNISPHGVGVALLEEKPTKGAFAFPVTYGAYATGKATEPFGSMGSVGGADGQVRGAVWL